MKSVIDLIKQPFHALKDTISKVVKTAKGIVKKIKETLLVIKRVVLSIGKSASVFSFSPVFRERSFPTICGQLVKTFNSVHQ